MFRSVSAEVPPWRGTAEGEGEFMFKRFAVATVLVGSLALLVASAVWAGSGSPSGERMYGQTSFVPTTDPLPAVGHFAGGGGTIESAYDDTTGNLIYIQTPNNAKVHPAKKIDPSTGYPVNVAPLYLPVYPTGVGIDPSTLNCLDQPADNCPDHGPALAFVAMGAVSSVYGDGVLGHDHLLGIASTGGDFNFIWEPVLVLFTNKEAASTHYTTYAQIQAVEAAGGAFEVPLPQLDFNCARVSAAAYWRGTPAPTVPAVPALP